METKISTDLYENTRLLYELLRADQNYDMIFRPIRVGDQQACLYFINGFVKDEVLEKLLEFFYSLTPEDLPQDSEELTKNQIPYADVRLLTDLSEVMQSVLAGMACLLIDGYDACFTIDCRSYPMRSISEPDKDKALRGSRDGFVETLVYNTALIRRRIRSKDLVMELLQAGEASKTDIAICYMAGRADTDLVDQLKERIQNMKIDALPMNQESLAEVLYKGKWINPFPKFKYTERPDAAAASLLDGKVLIMIDNAPTAMILPATLLDIMEEADDYYFPPITGSYLRISRLVIAILTLFLTPLWLLLLEHPQWIPPGMEFIQVEGTIHIPVIWQLLFLEFAIDGLKLAAINTPNTLSTPLSVIAGIVVGEFAVQSGWFNSEAMLYMAFVAIANYTQSNFELGYALKFMRLMLLILTEFFALPGFLVGSILVCLFIGTNKTVSGKSYLYPLLPFCGKQLKRRVLKEQTKETENKAGRNRYKTRKK